MYKGIGSSRGIGLRATGPDEPARFIKSDSLRRLLARVHFRPGHEPQGMGDKRGAVTLPMHARIDKQGIDLIGAHAEESLDLPGGIGRDPQIDIGQMLVLDHHVDLCAVLRRQKAMSRIDGGPPDLQRTRKIGGTSLADRDGQARSGGVASATSAAMRSSTFITF